MAGPYTTLIDAKTVAAHIHKPDWVVVDCRFVLMAPEIGRQDYDRGHLPGAFYADLERDLSGPRAPGLGRHPLPALAAFRTTLGRWGVSKQTQVVAYDEGNSVYASRLWWLLRALCGHEAVAVLDGGLVAWKGHGLPLSQEPPVLGIAGPYRGGKPRAGAVVDTDAISAVVAGRARRLLIDARGPERFQGLAEPIDPVAGHIPGAVNRPFEENLRPNKTFRDPEELRTGFGPLLGARSPEEVVHYCGSGVSACHNVLAMVVAGLGETTLYPGSWSAWVSDQSRPVARRS